MLHAAVAAEAAAGLPPAKRASVWLYNMLPTAQSADQLGQAGSAETVLARVVAGPGEPGNATYALRFVLPSGSLLAGKQARRPPSHLRPGSGQAGVRPPRARSPARSARCAPRGRPACAPRGACAAPIGPPPSTSPITGSLCCVLCGEAHMRAAGRLRSSDRDCCPAGRQPQTFCAACCVGRLTCAPQGACACACAAPSGPPCARYYADSVRFQVQRDAHQVKRDTDRAQALVGDLLGSRARILASYGVCSTVVHVVDALLWPASTQDVADVPDPAPGGAFSKPLAAVLPNASQIFGCAPGARARPARTQRTQPLPAGACRGRERGLLMCVGGRPARGTCGWRAAGAWSVQGGGRARGRPESRARAGR